MPAFPVRVFRTPDGYLAWADGLGTVEGRTLAETRRAARRLVESVVAGAFPDRPALDPTGTWEILEFRLEVRLSPAATSRVTRASGRYPHPREPAYYGPDRMAPAPRPKDATGASAP
ncbi:MAG TPA: hypothetical protein VEK13_04155 [Thermoplasmata archaeon]|nr:hypothetical protein [Thermoplasmata archaeon]